MAFCGKCGTEIRTGSGFCTVCGTKVAGAAPVTESAAPQVQPPAAPIAPPPIAPPPAPMVAIPSTPVPLAGGFCSKCGKPVGATDGFCKACGATLGAIGAADAPRAAVPAPVAPPPAAPVQVVAVPVAAGVPSAPVAVPQPVGAPRKSNAGIWIGLVIVALIVVVIVAIVLSGPKPEDTVDSAKTAYLNHDQANFDKYVNVPSVLSDWTDQGVGEWLRQNNTGALGTIVVQAVAAAVKSAYLPSLAQSVDQWVVSGNLADRGQATDSDQTNAWVANFVSSAMRTIASSQLTYQGVASKSVTDSTAILDVNVGSSASSQPIVLKVKLQKDGDHWQIVAIQDVAGLLRQLNGETPR